MSANYKINQFKDLLIAKAQGTPEFTNLPPVARTTLNSVIDSTASSLTPGFVNNVDLETNSALNSIGNNLLGRNNPVDVVNGNLSVNDLKDTLAGGISPGLSNALTAKFTNDVVDNFTNELPPILKNTLPIGDIKNALSSTAAAGIDAAIDGTVQLFSGETLASKIPQLPTVPNVGDILGKVPTLPTLGDPLSILRAKEKAASEALQEVNKKFDEKISAEAISESKQFNINNEDNIVKNKAESQGFIDKNAIYPTEEYKNKSDTDKLATGDINGTIVQQKEIDRVFGCQLPEGEYFEQPEIPYNAQYPYNKTIHTESGHVIEMDDTPGSERLHVYHKSGTFIELDQSGSVVKRTLGSSYEFIDRNNKLSIVGDDNISIGGNMKVFVAANAIIEVQGDTNLKCLNDVTVEAAGKLDLSATEEINLRSANINIQSTNFTNMKTEGNIFVSANVSIHNKCNSTMFTETLDTLNLKSMKSAFIETAQVLNLKATSQILADGSTVQLNEGLSLPATSATYANNANIGMIGTRTPVFTEHIHDPDITNFTDSAFMNSQGEDSDLDEDAEQALKELRSKGLTPPNTRDPVIRDSASPSSAVSDIVLPDDSLLLKTSFADNKAISNKFVLSQLSSKAACSFNPVRAQMGLSFGEILFNLSAIALNVCDPVKKLFPSMIVTSGLRYPKANSSNTSDHLRGQAVDIQFPGTNKVMYFDIAKKLAENLNYDKLLLEYHDKTKNMSGNPWIHISFKADTNRKLLFTYNNQRKHSSGLKRLA